MGQNEFIATDARLRVVANSEIGTFSRPGQVDPQRVICTEPSPDVATVVASSFGAGLSVLGYGSGAISAEQVEGMMSLVERTASIQLLRDKMYQTCLAFSNGAISGTSYAMIMSRLDETILSFLLGETAGGAFGRSGGVLGTEANADAQATLIGLPAAMQDLVKLGDELKVAQAEYDKSKVEHDAAKADYDKAAAATPKPDQTVLDSKKADADQKKTMLDSAQKRRDELLKLIQSRADATAKASGSVKTATATGGLTRSPSTDLAQVLKQMQEQFLSTDLSRDVVSACLVEMATQAELRSSAQLVLARAIGDVDRLKRREFANRKALSRVDQNVLRQADELDKRIGSLQRQIEQAKRIAGDLQRAETEAETKRQGLTPQQLNERSALDSFLLGLSGQLAKAQAELTRLERDLEIVRTTRNKLDPATLEAFQDLKAEQKSTAKQLEAANAEVTEAKQRLASNGEKADLASGFHEVIFNRLDEGLQADLGADNFRYFLPNLASVAARERTTSLARFCVDRLPEFMTEAQAKNAEHRLKKLEIEINVEKELTGRARAQVEIAEANAKKARVEAVGACAKINDAAQQKLCFAALGPNDKAVAGGP